MISSKTIFFIFELKYTCLLYIQICKSITIFEMASYVFTLLLYIVCVISCVYSVQCDVYVPADSKIAVKRQDMTQSFILLQSIIIFFLSSPTYCFIGKHIHHLQQDQFRCFRQQKMGYALYSLAKQHALPQIESDGSQFILDGRITSLCYFFFYL